MEGAVASRLLRSSKSLFACCDEQRAKAHIESLDHPDTRAIAQSLWNIEKSERLLVGQQQKGEAAWITRR
jgi:hypothetical protein